MSKVKMNEESIKALRLPELHAKYAEIVGEPTRTPNKAWLVRRILDAAKTHVATAKKKPAASKPATSTKRMKDLSATSRALRVRAQLPRSVCRCARNSSSSGASSCSSASAEGATPSRFVVNAKSSLNV